MIIKDFVENCNEGSNKGYRFLEVDVQYPEKKKRDIQNNLPFLHEIIKIEKVEKLAAKLHDKKKKKICYTHKKFKTNIKSRTDLLKNVHRVIKFN